MRFVSMYSASPVCSPSRSSVLTGRFMTRNGVWPGVFSPNSIGGLALNESTLPSLLREGGYETWMAGKWHLGVGADGAYLPYNRGFDHYYGVPYGIDMCSQVTVMDVTRDGLPAGACFVSAPELPRAPSRYPPEAGAPRAGAERQLQGRAVPGREGELRRQGAGSPVPLLRERHHHGAADGAAHDRRQV